MSDTNNETMRRLLRDLHDEMQSADVDDETRELMRSFDADVHALVDQNNSAVSTETVMDRATLLQANFSVSHPVANRFLTEVINALVKMGV